MFLYFSRKSLRIRITLKILYFYGQVCMQLFVPNKIQLRDNHDKTRKGQHTQQFWSHLLKPHSLPCNIWLWKNITLQQTWFGIINTSEIKSSVFSHCSRNRHSSFALVSVWTINCATLSVVPINYSAKVNILNLFKHCNITFKLQSNMNVNKYFSFLKEICMKNCQFPLLYSLPNNISP